MGEVFFGGKGRKDNGIKILGGRVGCVYVGFCCSFAPRRRTYMIMDMLDPYMCNVRARRVFSFSCTYNVFDGEIIGRGYVYTSGKGFTIKKKQLN